LGAKFAGSGPRPGVFVSHSHFDKGCIENGIKVYSHLLGVITENTKSRGGRRMRSAAQLVAGRTVRTESSHPRLLEEKVLQGAELRRAVLVETDFSGADLMDCNVFGVGAWNVKLSDKTNQSRLVVQDYNAPAVSGRVKEFPIVPKKPKIVLTPSSAATE